MSKRNFVAMILVACLMLSLTACGGAPASTATPAPTAEAAPAPAPAAPAASAAPDPVAAEGDWATVNRINDGTQTAQELYALAKEEGTVVLYSISSRCVKVKESFEAKYPGVICDAYDISTNELLEKISREYDAGVRNADVIHVKDQDGSLFIEKVQAGIFHNYYPADIVASIDNKSYLDVGMPLYVELNQWFYNDVLLDAPPIDSWWDLTRPEWKGKVLTSNPIENQNYMALFTGFVQIADEFAADYEREFGEPIVLSEGCPTAAHELFKRLVDNDLVFISSSDEICESVGTATTNPPIGYAASSKLRKKESDGWNIAPINILPSTGIPGTNYLYIVNEAPHPNAAKLLVRWMVGEADGKGEGFAPFNTLGGWPVRNNVTPAEGSTPLAEHKVQAFEAQYIYDNILDFEDFWISIQK